MLFSPKLPLELYTFANFARKYIDTKDDVPDRHWSQVKKDRRQWETPGQPSVIGVAATALALAVFSRTRASPMALDTSIQKYNEAVVKTQIILRQTSQALADEKFMTVVLLNTYEVRYTKRTLLLFHLNSWSCL